MSRGDLERLSKDELIELVLKLQRPAKTSRTSSKLGKASSYEITRSRARARPDTGPHEERSRPLLTALERFLQGKLALISQKSTLAVAIRYAMSRWEGLTLYAEDGRVEMDSNTVERSIRPLALTRKNALFAGSDRGGSH